MVRDVLCSVLYRCGVLFICLRVYHNLRSDKLTTPHFLFLDPTSQESAGDEPKQSWKRVKAARNFTWPRRCLSRSLKSSKASRPPRQAAAATGGRIPSCPATAATGIDTARNTGSRPPCNPTYLLTNSLYPNENENNLLGIVVPVTGSSRLYEGCRRADTGRCNAGDR